MDWQCVLVHPSRDMYKGNNRPGSTSLDALPLQARHWHVRAFPYPSPGCACRSGTLITVDWSAAVIGFPTLAFRCHSSSRPQRDLSLRRPTMLVPTTAAYQRPKSFLARPSTASSTWVSTHNAPLTPLSYVNPRFGLKTQTSQRQIRL